MRELQRPNIVAVCPVCAAPVPQRTSGRGGQRVYCTETCRRGAQSKRLNERTRERYANDPSFREQIIAYQREWRNARTADERRATRLRQRHGLTPQEFDERLARQGGRCAICWRTGVRVWHIDHDHACCPGLKSCGKCVRGILCELCNKGLGQFKDDAAALRRAAEYLERSA